MQLHTFRMDFSMYTVVVWGGCLTGAWLLTRYCIPWLKPRPHVCFASTAEPLIRMYATLEAIKQPAVFQNYLRSCKEGGSGSFDQPNNYPCRMFWSPYYPCQLHLRFKVSPTIMENLVLKLNAHGYTAWPYTSDSLACLLLVG